MTKEEITRIAREVGFDDGEIETCQLMFEHFAFLVASAERKETERLRALCQEMLSELFVYRASENLKDVTATIRARGQA